VSKPLSSRLAVVTGASRGIGRAVALELARQGAHVVALARSAGGLEELDDAIKAENGTATLVPADLKDFEALDRLGAAIHERWGKLDALVANAGVLGPVSPLAHVDPPAWDDVFSINVTANWRLIRSLDPLLRLSDAGRAIFLTSGAAHKCDAYVGPYSVSKAAVEALARTYAAETAATNVKVMIFSPGPTRTRMRAALRPGEDPTTLKTPEDIAPEIVRLASPSSTQSGLIYDWAQHRALAPQPPA
jgi:NAD(P)-dependent dehydrogenase (short-subunit alcohol dehydrogenase family)